MSQCETVEIGNDMGTFPPPTYEANIVHYKDHYAIITAARELNRTLSCDLHESYHVNNTTPCTYNLF